MTAEDKFLALDYDYKVVPPPLFFTKHGIVASKVTTIMDTPVGIEIHFITNNTTDDCYVAIFPINKPDSIGFINFNVDEIDAIHTQMQEIKNAQT